MKNTVITIGREFGSGGHEIAERCGQELGIPVYDQQMVSLACGLGEVREESIRDEDEKAVNPYLYHTMHEGNQHVARDLPAPQVLYELQSAVIRGLAQKHSCIIVGRCADYVLKDSACSLLRIFVKAPAEYRIKRKMKLENLTHDKAQKLVKKIDKRRRKYYESHTGQGWGEDEFYDMIIDIGEVSMDEAVKKIIREYRSMQE